MTQLARSRCDFIVYDDVALLCLRSRRRLCCDGSIMSDSITSTCCVQLPQQVESQQQESTTSCRTSSKSYNKLDNLSHSKSTTNQQLYNCTTISKSHNLLYNKATASRSNGVDTCILCCSLPLHEETLHPTAEVSLLGSHEGNKIK